MREFLDRDDLVLVEASIVECLRRSDRIGLHPQLLHAPLIYDAAGRKAMAALFQSYVDVAVEAHKPFLMFTPTWRANQARVSAAGFNPGINRDAARFLQDLREQQGAWRENIRIGGLIGCKNDCYRPEEGLSATEAEQFHGWQLEQLQRGGVDFLIAQTLPSVNEAVGIARAMEKTSLDYVISFVISRDGRVLDGTDLETAIGITDAATRRRPTGYMINCAYPSFLCADRQPPIVFDRLVGYQANASALDHCDLDGAGELHQERVEDWGELMLALNRDHGVKALGGCCGTGAEHLRYIVKEHGHS